MTERIIVESLEWLFREFEKRGVSYCVLRNYDFLPHVVGNDIDILISENSKDLVEEIVSECAGEYDWTLRRRGKPLYFIFYRMNEDSWIFFRLDIVTKVSSGRITYSPSDLLLRSTCLNNKAIRVLAPTSEIFHILIHSLLGPIYNESRYVSHLNKKISSMDVKWDELELYLQYVFPRSTVNYIIKTLHRNDVGELFKKRRLLKCRLLWKQGSISMVDRVIRIFKRAADKLRRLVRPTGLFVVLLGPDGVGKSTAGRQTVEIFKMFHRIVVHLHLGFRPAVLPTRPTFPFAKNNPCTKAEESQYRALERDTRDEMGFFRLIYYTLDYLLGYFIYIRPVIQRNGIVMAERYYYDYLAGFRKNPKVTTPLWIVKTLFMFMPKPGIVILLHADAEEVHRRRDELTLPEIQCQLEEYEKLGRKAKHFCKVSTGKRKDQVATEIFDNIVAVSNHR